MSMGHLTDLSFASFTAEDFAAWDMVRDIETRKGARRSALIAHCCGAWDADAKAMALLAAQQQAGMTPAQRVRHND